EEGGRGLLLVASLADRWGVGQRAPGKLVWCEFAVRASRACGCPAAPCPGAACAR
ncbi:ATP-binding protein, partial [Streptomyces sp. IBSBF 3136]